MVAVRNTDVNLSIAKLTFGTLTLLTEADLPSCKLLLRHAGAISRILIAQLVLLIDGLNGKFSLLHLLLVSLAVEMHFPFTHTIAIVHASK